MKFAAIFCLVVVLCIALVQSMSVGLNEDHLDHPRGIADHKKKANCNGGRGGRGGGGGGGGGGNGGAGTAGTAFPNFPPFNGTIPAGFPTPFPLNRTTTG